LIWSFGLARTVPAVVAPMLCVTLASKAWAGLEHFREGLKVVVAPGVQVRYPGFKSIEPPSDAGTAADG
jgi:hypothetical protein